MQNANAQSVLRLHIRDPNLQTEVKGLVTHHDRSLLLMSIRLRLLVLGNKLFPKNLLDMSIS
jgi:hypothetical protein